MKLRLPSALVVPAILFQGVLLAGGVPVDLRSRPAGSSAIYFTNANAGQLGVPAVTGDFNGDGLLDTAAAPFSASTLGRTNNGTVEVFFGDGGFGHTVNMAEYAGPHLTIHGAENWSALGVEMRADDFDGDGFDDLAIGSSHGRFIDVAPRAGEVVILFGRPEWGDTVRTMDMRTLPPEQHAKFFLGQREGDRLGSWFSSADIDGDNAADLVIGMDLSDGATAGKSNVGAAVIAWSAGTSHSGRSYIRVGEPETAGSLTLVYGVNAGDLFGATHFLADLDGDSQLELIVSAGVTRSGLGLSAIGYVGSGGGDGPANNRTNAGETTILWDVATLRAQQVVDLATAPSNAPARTVIYGERAQSYFGEELFAGDVDGDGINDLIVGALLNDASTQSDVGSAFLFPGGATLRSFSAIDLAVPPAGFVTVFDGSEFFGIAGDTIEMFDINADEKADIFFGVPYGTPRNRNSAGYVTVIYGGQPYPRMPSRVSVGLQTSPPLMTAEILGADAGDFMSYSSAFGDYDEDGILDFVVNAMAGDGFANGFPNAGEYYLLSGSTISRYAGAPVDPRASGGDAAAVWHPSQPVFGPVLEYRVRLRRDGAASDELVPVAGNSFPRALLSGSGAQLLGVRTLMSSPQLGEVESIEVPFTPPIAISASDLSEGFQLF